VRVLAQAYRDRADAENMFDELKNQWGWTVSRADQKFPTRAE
jgi:hypothetical protein